MTISSWTENRVWCSPLCFYVDCDLRFFDSIIFLGSKISTKLRFLSKTYPWMDEIPSLVPFAHRLAGASACRRNDMLAHRLAVATARRRTGKTFLRSCTYLYANLRFCFHYQFERFPFYHSRMIMLLDGHTSLDFWRVIYPEKRKLSSSGVLPPYEECASSAKDAWAMAPDWLSSDYLMLGCNILGTLVSDNLGSHQMSSTHRSRIWTRGFPDSSFYELNNGVFVSSPCFIFLQMATILSFAELIAYGNEICGRYTFDRSRTRGMRSRECPLVTKRQIESYLKKAKGWPG